MVFACLFFVTLSNYEVCENGNTIKNCDFQNNNGAIAEGHAYTGRSIPKIPYFDDFGGLKPTFLKPRW